MVSVKQRITKNAQRIIAPRTTCSFFIIIVFLLIHKILGSVMSIIDCPSIIKNNNVVYLQFHNPQLEFEDLHNHSKRSSGNDQ